MGFDVNRFVNSEEINEDLICNICKGVLEDGVWAPTCEHAFCKVCINEWLSRRSLCPNDRQHLNRNILKPIPRFMRNLLEKLKIKCDFFSNGCREVFSLESLRNHLNICDFNPEKRIECRNGCGFVLKKADFQYHNCMKSLRKLIGDENQRNEQNLAKLRLELNSLRKENQTIKSLVNSLQNDVKRLSSEKQLIISPPVITTNSSVSQSTSATVSSISGIHSDRRTVPNPYVLITPLQSSSMNSMDEPSSSTLICRNRRLHEEPPYKRRTTTIRVATPSPNHTIAHNLSNFSLPSRFQNPEEREFLRNMNTMSTMNMNGSPSSFISSATTLSISNDSNSEDNEPSVSLRSHFIGLDDTELEEFATETEVEEDVSVDIMEEELNSIEWNSDRI